MGDLGDVSSKVLLPIKSNWTVLQENIKRFQIAGLSNILIVVPRSLREVFEDHLKNEHKASLYIVGGGSSRTESVRNALKFANENLAERISSYLIHDGARPFFPYDCLVNYISESISENIGIVFGIPCTNTIKEISEDGFVKKTLDRNVLWEIQTPQIFPKQMLESAYLKSESDEVYFDDASIVEIEGSRVKIVKGSYDNFKITTKSDLIRIQTFFDQPF